MKVGVFTCWCGENIARTVDCEKVAEEVAKMPGVHCAVIGNNAMSESDFREGSRANKSEPQS